MTPQAALTTPANGSEEYASSPENLATTFENRDIPRYHEQLERLNQGDVDLLWVGDSITHFWETEGKAVWEKYYGGRKAMNFGVSGDRTGHVLWRMANSPMEKISPKLTIVLIGTNNVEHTKPDSDEMHSTPEETVEGIQMIVNRVWSYILRPRFSFTQSFHEKNRRMIFFEFASTRSIKDLKRSMPTARSIACVYTT